MRSGTIPFGKDWDNKTAPGGAQAEWPWVERKRDFQGLKRWTTRCFGSRYVWDSRMNLHFRTCLLTAHSHTSTERKLIGNHLKIWKPISWIILFFKINILFIYFWLCWVFVAACRLSLVAASGGYSSLRCVGFSLRWLLLLQNMGSRCVGFSSCGTRALEHRLSSSGARA